MRYQVPQFIDVEDKIFGPLTIKQFVYIAGGAGIAFVLWRLLPLFIALILIAPVAVFALSLAFYRPNNRPFINTLEYAFRYAITNKLYLWKSKDVAVVQTAPKTAAAQPQKDGGLHVPKLSESKLKDLAWSLDIKENLNPVTPPNER